MLIKIACGRGYASQIVVCSSTISTSETSPANKNNISGVEIMLLSSSRYMGLVLVTYADISTQNLRFKVNMTSEKANVDWKRVYSSRSLHFASRLCSAAADIVC
jgi:hypothetical protein